MTPNTYIIGKRKKKLRMKCIMLGTGHAIVTHCFNTCFVLEENDSYFLVDTGGGGQLLTQFEKAHIDISKLKAIFISHKHTDHIMGVFWLIRIISMYTMMGKIQEPIYLYSHEDCIQSIRTIAKTLFTKELACLDKTLLLVPIQDLEETQILNHSIQFFDTHARKETQYGFNYYYDDCNVLTFCGDEPLIRTSITENTTYLMHEAFCLFAQKEKFHPERAGHSTALQACQLAQNLHIPNIILYHTEDSDMEHRKENYTKEGQSVYNGTIFVPNDLEEITL